jgi:hypothetical protein
MPLRNVDSKRVVQAIRRVVPREPRAQPAHLDPNDAVRFWIERVPFVKSDGAKHVLFEPVPAAGEGFVNGEPQQLAQTLGALERAAAQNRVEVRGNGGAEGHRPTPE